MNIYLAEHRGFCYGVKRAVDLAIASKNNKGPVYTLGDIIHNPQMVKKLSDNGVYKVDSLKEISEGTVIIRSHGVGPKVYAAAEDKGLEIVDATCPNVKKAQQAAANLAKLGYQVVIVGEADHPEVKSIIEWSGTSPIIIESAQEAENLSFIPRMGIVTQTTFSIKEFDTIINILKTKCEENKIDRTICRATDLRQQAAVELAGKVQLMIVVGGKHSANTARLAELCRKECINVQHIETAHELKADWFENVNEVGLTAGASTPDWVIEEVYNKMQEMGQEMTQNVQTLEDGMIVKGKVVGVQKDEVFVDIGYKAEGIIPLSELAFPMPENATEVVSKDQIIDVYVVSVESSDGSVQLSKVKADNIVAWDNLLEAMEKGSLVTGKVLEVVKGGLRVAVMGIKGFIPASQLSLRYVEDLSVYVGSTLELKVVEVDKEKNKAVLSRRQVLEAERKQREQEIYSSIKPGNKVAGTVSRLAKFGAFVDLGGVDGLIHISDLAWNRVSSPEEVVNVGDKVEAIVLKVDPQAKKIALSLKEVQRDPWFDEADKIAEGMVLKGKITKVASFGAFVELSQGLEGLIHISQLSQSRVNKVEDVVSIGQEVTVKVINIDKKVKRIGLSISEVQQDSERKEYEHFMHGQKSFGLTIGDKLGHLFKRED